MKLPNLEVPRLGLASFRRRILFRGAFLLLATATLGFALVLLVGEKDRSYQSYRRNLQKTEAEIVAKLRHPAGQLALLNPSLGNAAATPLRPLLLPFGAIDFDDAFKARQAVETAGCSVQYPDGSSLCVAVGNNPYAGGFVYLVGSFFSGPLIGSTVSRSRTPGGTDLSEAHRARVSLTLRGETKRWIAPFEVQSASGAAMRGRLTGFVEPAPPGLLPADARAVRDFRGWLWQEADCVNAGATPCRQRSFVSIRLPVDVFREALFQKPRPVWPPPDLDSVEVRLEMLAPGGSAVLFDSNAPGATALLSRNDLALALAPGEVLAVRKAGTDTPLFRLKGVDENHEPSAPWLEALVRRLPVSAFNVPNPVVDGRQVPVVHTPVGDYEIVLTGDLRSVDRALSVTATRLSWFVAAMLGAIIFVWLVIEIGLIRRIALLTQRAAALSHGVHLTQAGTQIANLDVSDLRGSDELGILASGLSDLLQRVKDDVQREQIRAQQERDMWHAVGHEIMSPLQSLMVLHPAPTDASHRYVQRMQQAVRVLYGTASPSEALEAAALNVGGLDLDEFLRHVAGNAHFAGILGVHYQPAGRPMMVRADEFPLEDVVTHILRNADQFRTGDSPIELTVLEDDSTIGVAIHNQGPAIEEHRLERIFEYGVSDAQRGGASVDAVHRGQGLFVAKTYMAKMGGTVNACNDADGVTFVLTLQRAS